MNIQKTNLPDMTNVLKGLEDVETLEKGAHLASEMLNLEISSNLVARSKLVIHTYHPTGSSITNI